MQKLHSLAINQSSVIEQFQQIILESSNSLFDESEIVVCSVQKDERVRFWELWESFLAYFFGELKVEIP